MKKLLGLMVLFLPLAAQAVPESFAPIVAPLMPAVVNISTTQKVETQAGPVVAFPNLPENDPQAQQFRELFKQFNQQLGGGEPQEREVTSLGSGFVIDPSGYVVTNNHVVMHADEITVIFADNTHLPAKLIGRDPKTDLALLKVTPAKPLTYVRLGDSDAMKVGDWVIAVGNPFGLGGSVSAGIVSARGRNINAGPFDDFIQTDAAINRGNSGGPLFNTAGEVIGINSAIFSPNGNNIGIGFAIPTSLAKPVLAQLREQGHVHRAALGVKIQEVSDEIANSIGMSNPHGAMVLEVTPGSPAEKAGVQAGDVITSFDGTEIKEMRNLPRAVADTKIGKTVDVKLLRKGHELTYHVTVTEQKDDAADEDGVAAKPDGGKPGAKKKDDRVLGMVLTPVTPELRTRYNLAKNLDGLLVVEEDRSSAVVQQGIRPGDIILDVNQSTVKTSEDVSAQVDAAKKAKREYVLMRVARGDQVQFVTVPVK